MTEKKMALAKELANELDELFTQRIVSMYEWSIKDPTWMLARQWSILVRGKLYDLMDAAGISRVG